MGGEGKAKGKKEGSWGRGSMGRLIGKEEREEEKSMELRGFSVRRDARKCGRKISPRGGLDIRE